ncbi:MAG: class I SAM-dependent methyltransferase [Bacteroidota bacterium]|nr:class I SAM-dependent methyltransferase [Bacteroidota bacterium]
MSSKYYDKVGNYYDEDAGDFDSRYWSNPVLQQIRQIFREEVKRFDGTDMLEIGCGTGMDLVHFATIFPERNVSGIDISGEMVRLCNERKAKSGCANIEVRQGSVEDVEVIFPNRQFDVIYVFFGALNTVENLPKAAQTLKKLLRPDGTMVLTFVNKWYLGGMFLELVRFHFSKAFGRIKPVWSGYSPSKFLPSHCYSPRQIKCAFSGSSLKTQKGFSIVHPAWYYTGINRRLGKLRKYLWRTDLLLNKTFLWRFGEYTLFVFKK